NSSRASLTYANLPLAQNPSVLKGYSRDSYHPLRFLNIFTLSRLELRACDISWKSPLFKGLKHLKINSLSVDARPRLSVWLDALEEIPQLKTLVLHSASPITSSVPFDVKRTVTLPSLTYFNISASPEDCGLALAHLVLPALISLCVTAFSGLENGGDVERMLPYVARHAHGPQDTRPLQSVLIHGYASCVNILAWPVPDIDVEVHDPPTFFATTPSPRVTLSITSNVWHYTSKIHFEVLDVAMAALPLDGLVMLTAEHLGGSDSSPKMDHFWLRYAPRWPLLRRVRLGRSTEWGFITMLLEEIGGGESPLLPSLTGLVVVHARVNYCWTLRLRDALMRRVEQGVPLEVLDLRMCFLRFPTTVQLLSEIVVDVLGPSDEITLEWEQNLNMWSPIIRSLEDDNSGAEDDSDTDVWELKAIFGARPEPPHGLVIATRNSKHTASARLQAPSPLPSLKLVTQLRKPTEVSITKAREALAASTTCPPPSCGSETSSLSRILKRPPNPPTALLVRA
ncbi:hypothetical protein EDB86DRAFT_3204146, partial [Lactarius hatsudake]